MVTGLGIDMIEVARVQEKIEKEQGFRELVFSNEEIEYCESKTHKYEHYAARFAAKEAFFKALGTGWTNGTSFNEVELHASPAGQPLMRFLGDTEKSLLDMRIGKVSVSLSHLKEIAAAVVVIEEASGSMVP